MNHTTRRILWPAAINRPPIVLLEDTFDDDDDTLLVTGHTISPTNTPAAAWSAEFYDLVGPGFHWTINNNRAVNQSCAGYAGAVCNVGVANCTLIGNLARGYEYNDAGLSFNCNSDLSKRWWVILARDRIDIYEDSTQRASTAHTYVNYTSYLLVVTISGDTVTASADGAIVTYTASDRPGKANTYHGLAAVYGTGQSIDNFKVLTP